MAKIDIEITEAKALREALDSVKVSVPVGYVLGTLVMKIERALTQEQEKELKKKYSDEAKDK